MTRPNEHFCFLEQYTALFCTHDILFIFLLTFVFRAPRPLSSRNHRGYYRLILLFFDVWALRRELSAPDPSVCHFLSYSPLFSFQHEQNGL